MVVKMMMKFEYRLMNVLHTQFESPQKSCCC